MNFVTPSLCANPVGALASSDIAAPKELAVAGNGAAAGGEVAPPMASR